MNYLWNEPHTIRLFINMIKMKLGYSVVLIMMIFIFGLISPAQSIVKKWKSKDNSNWHSAQSWEPSGIPTVNDDVYVLYWPIFLFLCIFLISSIINLDGVYTVIINQPVECKSLKVENLGTNSRINVVFGFLD